MKLKNYFLIAVLIGGFQSSNAQFVNNGAQILVQENARIHIQGDFVHQDGFIQNEGQIEVGNNWTNNGSANPISMDVGMIDLVGAEQVLGGITSSVFFELTFSGDGEKTLAQDIVVNEVLALGNASLLLDENRLTINNESNTSIIRENGYIQADSPENYGWMQWNVGNELGNFEIPFGNEMSYLPVNVEITTAGMGPGNLSFTTYPTTPDNLPYPQTVTDLSIDGANDSLNMVDRFWIMQEDSYMMNPIADVQLTYDPIGDIHSNNTIDEAALNIARWTGNDGWENLNSTVNGSAVSASDLQAFGAMALRSKSVIDAVLEVDISNTSIAVYPNPVLHRLMNIEFETTTNGEAILDLYNHKGALVYHQIENVLKGKNDLQLRLPGLSAGTYFLVVQTETQLGKAQVLFLNP